MENNKTIKKIIDILSVETEGYTPTLIESIIKEYGEKPFLILICCMLSPRVKDSTTIHVCRNLLKIAKTPAKIFAIPMKDLEKIVFKTGFYKTKAKALHNVCGILLEEQQEKVPKTLAELLKLPGVGRKTANLVLGVAFGIPAICVDTHVHRISNRLGLVKTKTPKETEFALEKVLPQKYWIGWNDLLVKFGQNICTPTSPWCSKCAIYKFCKRVGINKSR